MKILEKLNIVKIDYQKSEAFSQTRAFAQINKRKDSSWKSMVEKSIKPEINICVSFINVNLHT